MEKRKTYKLKNICSKIGSGAPPKGGKDAYMGGDIALIRNQNAIQKSYLLSLSQGGAARNALAKRMIEDIEIPLPTISHQEKVISILFSLDDKIELNRRINDYNK